MLVTWILTACSPVRGGEVRTPPMKPDQAESIEVVPFEPPPGETGLTSGEDSGAVETPSGPCAADMALVGDVCMDLYEAPNTQGELPLVMFTFLEAEDWCGARGKRLCLDTEWERACEGSSAFAYPYGDSHETSRCNDDKIWRKYEPTDLHAWPGSASSEEIETLAQLLAVVDAAAPNAAEHVSWLYQGDAAGDNPTGLLRIVNAFTALGGRQVNLTGGEPLAHPGLFDFVEAIDKRATRVVLNSNVVLARRLLERPRVAKIDGILASLHTTDDASFRRSMGGASAARVMANIVALHEHGYDVEINYSLGPHNSGAFGEVLDFAVEHGIALKAIALVRPNEDPAFYGGDWVDPSWLDASLVGRGAVLCGESASFGGRTTTWSLGNIGVKVKNIAEGRLVTDFCGGCTHADACGEGIYGLRVGVDGLWKPCLLRTERFVPVGQQPEEEILRLIDAMIGRWDHARFRRGRPD